MPASAHGFAVSGTRRWGRENGALADAEKRTAGPGRARPSFVLVCGNGGERIRRPLYSPRRDRRRSNGRAARRGCFLDSRGFAYPTSAKIVEDSARAPICRPSFETRIERSSTARPKVVPMKPMWGGAGAGWIRSCQASARAGRSVGEPGPSARRGFFLQHSTVMIVTPAREGSFRLGCRGVEGRCLLGRSP